MEPTITTHELAEDGYLECAGWLPSWDERDTPEDRERGCDTDARHGPFGESAHESARDAIAAMLAMARPEDIETYVEAYGWGEFGHDVWLTRNGHGAGFWDRDMGDMGERLSEVARSLGEATSWVDEGGTVEIDD
jgi:hypothetical protein